jgi:hypothetical protein
MPLDEGFARIFEAVRHAIVILTPDLQSLACTEDTVCSKPVSGSGVG